VFVRWTQLISFFLRISSLEYKIEKALYGCIDFQERIKDQSILNDLKAIEYRLDYARLKAAEIRNRGRDLLEYEDGEGL
jgi:hypothetical protein